MTTTTPSWIASITDTTLRADMAAADLNGVVNEAAMAKLFADLAAELTAGHTTLSASQFADLKLIAADLNQGEVASPYLTYVVNALVNGSAANASWTGGAASAVALGNLAAGATATHLTELAGNWLLGTDLPSDVVAMSGSASFTVSFSANTSSLFASTGPSMNDVNQGYLGDCYLLSSLAEVAHQNSAAITSMITDNGNNTYGVRFYVNGVAEYVTVSNKLADGGHEFNTGANLWASLVEQAYAQLQAAGSVTGNSYSGNSFSAIGNGGVPGYALAEITGASQITEFAASGGSWSKYTFNNGMAYQGGTSGNTTASLLATIVAALGAHDDVILSSNTNATDASGHQTLVAGHALSIYGVDSSNNMLEVRNPWGSEPGQYWDTTFEVSLATLLSAGDWITLDNAGGPAPTPVMNNALVADAAALQANTVVKSFTIADSAANVQAGLAALLADSKLTAISLTDPTTPTLSLTGAAYAADAAVLAKITSAYKLAISAATASQAAALQANSHVTGFAISDTAANVVANLNALVADSNLGAITLTDTAKPTLTLTATTYLNDTSVLAKIGSAFTLAVTGASLAQAASLQTDGHVASFTASLASTDLLHNLGTLLAETKISAITLTDSATVMQIGDSAWLADASLFGKIAAYNVQVTDGTVAQATALQASAHVSSFMVSDTAANVLSGMTGLLADGKALAVSFTDVGTVALTMTETAWLADATVFAKIHSAYGVTVTDATVAQAAALQTNAHVTGFTVNDTAAHVTAALGTLNADTHLAGLTISEGGGAVLTLTGSHVAASINVGADTAAATGGMSAATASFTGTVDAITLGTGATVINQTLVASSGVTTVAGFIFGTDELMLNLNGAATSTVHAADTLVNGVHAVAIYDSAAPNDGVVLTGLAGSWTAATIMASHVTYAHGDAIFI